MILSKTFNTCLNLYADYQFVSIKRSINNFSNYIMAVETSKLLYTHNGITFEGYLCLPNGVKAGDGRKFPAVMVCHAFHGITEFEEEQTRRVSEQLGVVAFASDLYGIGQRGKTYEESAALMKPLREGRTTLLRERLLVSLNKLKALDLVDPNQISVIGYCFGGLCALDLARINVPGVLAVVSFHGTLLPLPDQPLQDSAKFGKINASVLVCHGDADPHINTEQCDNFKNEVRARQADWHFIYYGNAKHGFTEPKNVNSTIPGVNYDKNAAHRSWVAMIDHLQNTFQNSKA